MIVPFWIQGLAFGVYYVTDDDEYIDESDKTYMVQLALGFLVYHLCGGTISRHDDDDESFFLFLLRDLVT
jgi:hypothetical protein